MTRGRAHSFNRSRARPAPARGRAFFRRSGCAGGPLGRAAGLGRAQVAPGRAGCAGGPLAGRWRRRSRRRGGWRSPVVPGKPRQRREFPTAAISTLEAKSSTTSLPPSPTTASGATGRTPRSGAEGGAAGDAGARATEGSVVNDDTFRPRHQPRPGGTGEAFERATASRSARPARAPDARRARAQRRSVEFRGGPMAGEAFANFLTA